MTGLEKIQEKILAQSEENCAKIIAQANEEAKSILINARQTASEMAAPAGFGRVTEFSWSNGDFIASKK